MTTTPALPLDNFIDVDLANRLARLETYNKHYYRPNTYLHKWWARRCGTTFRFILKQMVTDPARQDYYSAGGLDGRIILDPMMGGGTTLHEALRLGANAIGVDLDPIPVLQARATLSDTPLPQLERAFKKFYTTLRHDLAPYYLTTCPHCACETESWYVLYGARRRCACGVSLVVDSLILRQEMDGSVLRLCSTCRAVIEGDAPCTCGERGRPTVVERGQDNCPHCGKPYVEEVERPFYGRYEPLVVSGHCPEHKLFMRAPDAPALQGLALADGARAGLTFERAAFAIDYGRKSVQLLNRGVDNYLDLFSSRQLLYLDRAIAHLAGVEPETRLNLGLLVSTSLEFNSMLCGYKGKHMRRPGAIRHTFAHHAYSLPSTALENNPLYHRRASGTLQKLFHARVRRARQWAAAPRERDLAQEKATFVPVAGEVDAGTEVSDICDLNEGSRRFLLQQGSATQLALPDCSVDAIITDPPYFDSVQYSDLSAFFRVWLRQLLPDDAVWGVDLRESAVDPHNNDRESRYAELMTGIFGECARVLRRPHGRLAFTFHHWNPKGWAALTIALQQASFRLLNYAVVHAENPISVHISNMNALTDDAILILAPHGAGDPPDWARPLQISTASSAEFCAGCATLLGWLLAQNLAAGQIDDIWLAALS
jgi:putative DNA methylase